MFGMGFTEILIILVIAILFLGPDKLPTAMIEIAKFFRNVKKTVGSVKESLEEEMNVSEIKKEALAYKKELLETQNKISKATDTTRITSSLTDLGDSLLDDVTDDVEKKKVTKEEKVTFKKKKQEEENIDV
jgi:sec-independent protein translocase protein TatB